MKKTILYLKHKETGEIRKVDFKARLKTVRKLRKLQKQGYELVKAEGDAKVTQYVNKEVSKYQDPNTKYKPEMPWTLASHMTKQKVSDIKSSFKRFTEKKK